ncbi:MAG TPA: hypothetical protein VE377_13400 [Candidatus Dormibacteraeota bacterium]|nr:hypothetical protein [Candidatus Dormibacteraeota bacterium]
MGFRFEYDATNTILLGVFEGHLTEESGAAFYAAIRQCGTATDARAGIWDFSDVTAFTVASDTIRRFAKQDPAMPDAANRPCFMIAPDTHLFGLSRMFQIHGEDKRPLLQVVRSLDEALAALGVHSPNFEPLD